MTMTEFTPTRVNGTKVATQASQPPPLVAVSVAPATDPILYWNAVALEANRISHTDGSMEQTGPTLSSRALAIVHLAMYDAFAGVRQNPVDLPPYLPGLPAVDPSASIDVAVAAAASITLSALFPTQQTRFTDEFARANLSGTGFAIGYAFGAEVARRILDDRKNDPNAKDTGYVASTARGAHRVDPNNPGQGFHAPYYGERSKGFAITQRFVLDSPPALSSPEYLDALKDVWGKGIMPELMGTLPSGIVPRTPEETLIGLFWAYDGSKGLGTPPRLYNQIVREVAIKQGASLPPLQRVAENARLFALVNAAMADAGILAWEQKYVHDFWRPVVGIRENDVSMGPEGVPGIPFLDDDPVWLPLGAPKSNELAKNVTPNFPAYPSGHATFGAAALHITRLFYGKTDYAADDLFVGLNLVSDELNSQTRDNLGAVRPRHTRSYPDGLWQMILENGRSRVYLGVHWQFDAYLEDVNGDFDSVLNVGGVKLGLNIAESIFNHGRAQGLKKSSV